MKRRESPPMDKVMAYLDGEMSAAQRRDFRRLLDEHPEWQAQVEEMAAIVKATGNLRMKIDPHTWDHYWEQIDSRLQRRVGWTAALVGSLILITWGFLKVLAHAENDFVRLGIVLVAVGLVTLFISVLRGRFMEISKDRYTRIRR